MQGAQSIVAARGVRGLYNGLLPTLLRDVPELTLQFQLYESLRFAMQHRGKVSTSSQVPGGQYPNTGDLMEALTCRRSTPVMLLSGSSFWES